MIKIRIKKIALIIPPSKHEALSNFKIFDYSPLDGLATIATILIKNNYEVKVYDLRYNNYDDDSLSEEVATDFDLVGITTPSDSYLFTKNLLDNIKILNKDIVTVLGGPLVSSASATFLNNTKADYIILGEGEESFLELIQGINNGIKIDKIAGISYKDNGRLVNSKPRKQITMLDKLPIPNLSIWPSIKDKNCTGLYYSSTRGCPYNCSFCSKSIPEFTEKSPAKVYNELKHFKYAYDIDYIHFTDLTFDINTHRVDTITKSIADLNLNWGAMLRVDGINEQLLKKMKNAGCDVVRYGIESYSQEVLDHNGKGITLSQIDDAIKYSLEEGLTVIAWFIIGLPGQTKQSIDDTINFIEKNDIIPRVHYLIPLPGTRVVNKFYKINTFQNELELLDFLSKHGYGDELINICDINEQYLTDSYNTIYNIMLERSKMSSW